MKTLLTKLRGLCYGILFLVGLRYLFATDLFPYHEAFLNDEVLKFKATELMVSGLRMIGAAYIGVAFYGYYFLRKDRTASSFGIILVALPALQATWTVGFLLGFGYFLTLVILESVNILFHLKRQVGQGKRIWSHES